MASELSAPSTSPEFDKDEEAAVAEDQAYLDRIQRDDPERYAKARDAARRSLGLFDATPSYRSARAEPLTTITKLSDYDFPIENLVFEGGGGKGRIYSGALKCLRDAGIKARRFAGTSAGAITAALLAVNVTPEEIDEFMSEDLEALLTEGGCSPSGLVLRILTFFSRFGFFHADKFVEFLGGILKKKTGNADVTFQDVLTQFNNELCITAVDVNLLSIMYFHPKTTPSTPVRTAVRMSMSIPAMFTPIPYTLATGYRDYFVDGGALCNYPVHVFDGWWLSMNMDDNYFTRLYPFETLLEQIKPSNRFGTFNEKTLGFVSYDFDDVKDKRQELDERITDLRITRPDTPLYRMRMKERERKFDTMTVRRLLIDVLNRFVNTFRTFIQLKDDDYYCSREQFINMFKNLKPKAESPTDALTTEDVIELFGKHYDANVLFGRADTRKEGEVRAFNVLLALEKELKIHTLFLGHWRKESKGIREYSMTLLSSVTFHAGKIYNKSRDLERTVGLYTDYISTMDFSIDSRDQTFLNEQGYAITERFLRDYISKNNLKPRTGTV